MRRLLLIALLCAQPLPAHAAEVVPWLYEVAVPVTDQSNAERDRGAALALGQLLTRLTGLALVPRTPEVAEALAAAERYYSEFRYAQGPEQGVELLVQFEAAPVLDLIHRAGLPVWRATRERVLAWVVIQDGGDRQLVGATSELPLVAGLEAEARKRGLPLTLPLLDLEDELAVDPAAVWGRLSQVIDPASRRYGADVLLLGRITPAAEGGWDSDWEFWVDGMVVPFVAEGEDLLQHGIEAVNVLADELAARRVVLARQAGQLRVAVTGITSPADYGELLRYIRSLEFVQQVGVSGMRDQRLWLLIDTSAEPARLLETFERDRRLFDDQLALGVAADLTLVWRSGG